MRQSEVNCEVTRDCGWVGLRRKWRDVRASETDIHLRDAGGPSKPKRERAKETRTARRQRNRGLPGPPTGPPIGQLQVTLTLDPSAVRSTGAECDNG